jgi:phospholipid-binding lipoprotein MlaA
MRTTSRVSGLVRPYVDRPRRTGVDEGGARLINKLQFMTALLLAGGGLAGCVGLEYQPPPEDPLEAFNRGVYLFNRDVDRALVRPVAETYDQLVPEPIDRGVTNVFENLADVGTAVSNGLQLKMGAAGSDLGRVLVNSTVGLLGVFDVASGLGLPKHDEDLGQVLGYWGVDAGPYLVLPLLGPSSVRDAVGLAGDLLLLDPLYYAGDDGLAWGLYGLRFTDRRSDLLAAGDVISDAALDEYDFVRDAYLQRRAYQINDGQLPEDDLFLDFEVPAE